MKNYKLSPLVMSSLIATTLVACKEASKDIASTDTPASKTAAATPDKEATKLVIYSGRSEGLVGSVLKKFDEAHPEIEIDVRYNKTPALANQVKAEGEQCPADVLWFQDSGYLSSLKDQLAPLPEAITSTIDQRFLPSDKRWLGITGRLRVLVYNTAELKPEQLPRTLKALSDKKWKGKLGWAPGNASLHAHVSALRHTWGEEETEKWLNAMKANKPMRFPKNSPQVKAAHAGEISIGWVNHYYLHKLKTTDYKAANFSFPEENDPGNVLMLSGAAIRSGSKNKDAAEKLLKYLVSKDVQTYFAKDRFEYPTKPGIATHPDVEPLTSLKLNNIDQSVLADVEKSVQLLNKLGIE